MPRKKFTQVMRDIEDPEVYMARYNEAILKGKTPRQFITEYRSRIRSQHVERKASEEDSSTAKAKK